MIKKIWTDSSGKKKADQYQTIPSEEQSDQGTVNLFNFMSDLFLHYSRGRNFHNKGCPRTA